MQTPKSKMLFIDIETSPIEAYTWGVWNTNVIEITKETRLLSVAWKWSHSSKCHFAGLPDYELYDTDPTDDYGLCHTIHELLDEADVVVAHNGNAFDIKRINARLLVNDFPPPSHYKAIDTLKTARKYFKFDSNKLNDLAKLLGLGSKVKHTGFSLWKDCLNGCPKAWRTMERYNKVDVKLLEDVYMKLRPYMTNHPNAGQFDIDNVVCPTCGSCNIQQRGYQYAKTRTYKRFVCKDCGAWSRSTACEKTNIGLTN